MIFGRTTRGNRPPADSSFCTPQSPSCRHGSSRAKKSKQENITNTVGIIHEEIDNLVTTTVAQVEHLKTSSFSNKVKAMVNSAKQKLKQFQGKLSHCFGGGKTSI